MLDLSIGGLPYRGFFEVTDVEQSSGWHCRLLCGDFIAGTDWTRPMEKLLMFKDVNEDGESNSGWQGGYYQVFDMTGKTLFGGALVDSYDGHHDVCLPVGCSLLKMPLRGSEPSRIHYEICGHHGESDDLVRVCVDVSNQCSAEDIVESLRAEEEKSFCNSTPTSIDLPLIMFDFGNSTEGVEYLNDERLFSLTITTHYDDTDVIISKHEIRNTFMHTFDVCLPEDGCYGISFETRGSSDHRHFQFSLCGQLSNALQPLRFCAEKNHDICYGLTGCPSLVSHTKHSEFQYYFLYTPFSPVDNDEHQSPDVIVPQKVLGNGNLHGVHELCAATNGIQHTLLLGAGKKTGDIIRVCERDFILPAKIEFYTVSNGSSCEISHNETYICKENGANAFLFILLDTYGDGWGSSDYRVTDITGTELSSGTLGDGEISDVVLCLSPRKVYRLQISRSADDSEIMWVICGYMGSGSADLDFEVSADGIRCTVAGVSDGDYERNDDDDFSFPTLAVPSAYPSVMFPSVDLSSSPTTGSSRPHIRPWFDDDDDLSVVPKYLLGYQYSELIYSTMRIKLLSYTDTTVSAIRAGDVPFVNIAVRKVLKASGFEVWNVELIDYFTFDDVLETLTGISSFNLICVLKIVSAL